MIIEDQPIKRKNYLQRNWKTILIFIGGLYLYQNQTLYKEIGTLGFAVALISLNLLAASAMRAIQFPDTSERDAWSGKYTMAWENLTDFQRVIITTAQWGIFLLSFAIGLASLG